MYGTSPFILIILPLLFQLIYGRKAIGETISLQFGMVCLISFILQIILSIVSFYIASYNFAESMKETPYRCGMGLLGIITLEFLLIIILIVIMIIQHFIKRSYEK